jgi:hypothetical protein
LFGRVARVRVEPLGAPSFSSARLERVVLDAGDGRMRALVLKTAAHAHDWLAVRTADRAGREAALLDEPALAGIGAAFRSAVLAYAREPDAYALLMEDVSADLLPDERAPIRAEHERALVTALARLHARFWDAPALASLDGLATPTCMLDLLAPAVAESQSFHDLAPPAFRERVIAGWEVARRRLAPAVFVWLDEPAASLFPRYADLPHTLFHGDVKVANFAFRPDGTVVAFDWALIGRGPCAFDLGWYLAVNASRLAGTKEEFAAAYRAALERELGRALDDAMWRSTLGLAVLQGARSLLWSKALALEAGSDAARAEFEWWAGRLAETAPI